MKLISTRGAAPQVSAAEAILRGLAPDGGLYLPESLPVFSPEEREALGMLPYPALAARVLEGFLPGFDREELSVFTRRAYASFRHPAVTPLRDLGDGLWTLELFHGPTCAFKDLALQLLPLLLAAAGKTRGEHWETAILTATSGDTGKAALAGFAGAEGCRIAVFYPAGGVSDIQRAQMVTQEGDNVLVLGVEGCFDDAQTGVKRIFSDRALAARLSERGIELSSANSINWGRLAPQVAYYYAAYAALRARGAVGPGEPVDFSVPTGNFGDILAGYLAKRSGLPVGRLLCASNSNNVLTDFLRTGVYDRRRPFLRTMSPSMDILVSSNLERLLYLLTGDSAQVAAWMAALGEEGRYDVGGRWLAALREEGFAAYWADEAETARTIRRTWEEAGYLADPHTAVALSAAEQHRREGGARRPCVALATASPFKFAPAMLEALGQAAAPDGFAALDALAALAGEEIPAPLAALRDKRERFTGVVAREDMSAAVQDWLVG